MIISNFSTTVDQALTNADLEGSQSPKSPSILKSHLKIVGSPEKSVRFQSQSQSKNTIVKINPSFKEKLQANLGFSGNPYAIIKPSVNKLQQESPIQSSNRVKTIISTTKDKLMQRIDLNLNTKSKTHIKARSFSLIPFNNNFDESDIDKTPSPSRQTKKALDFRPRSINYEFRSSRFYGRLSQFYKSESSTVSIENTPVVNGQNMT